MFKTLAIYYFNILAWLKLKIFFKGKIIGLAGCYGKSSAINLLENVIKTSYSVISSNKNGKGLNSESGIPFVVLGISPDSYGVKDWIRYFFLSFRGFFKKIDAEILLLEMGVDKPDDMNFLTKFYKPNIGILINSNNTHSANFENLHLDTKRSYEDLISEENGYIFERAKEAIFYNLEDPEVIKQVPRFKKKLRFGYAQGKGAIKKFDVSLNGTKIELKYYGKIYEVNFADPLLDEYQSTFELVIKLAEYLQIGGKEIKRGLESYILPPGRCQIFDGVKDCHILDSSYNSSYVPAASAISLLSKISRGRKIAVLGDMRELGELSEKEHRKLALIAAKHVDIVLTVGPMMKEYFVPEFEQNKNENQVIHQFDTTKEALNFLKLDDYKFIQKDDTILVKGSQNTLLLEIIVEDLLQNQGDVKKLCRRGEFYEKERKKLLEIT